ncbi:hypothetical protein DVH05_006510 [Phytophthora capsici]|nr:hypothetical protein DVH05_006510 [Phytophthora capsici]
MVKLCCVIVGVVGSEFDVNIAKGKSVHQLKEVIKAKNKKLLENVDTRELQLFLAKTADGTWLSLTDHAVNSLRNGIIPTKVKALLKRELYPCDKIKDLLEDVPTENTIHVLVMRSSLHPFYTWCPQWTSIASPFPPLVIDSTNPVLHIPEAYTVGSGLHNKKGGLLLYLRKERMDGWKALSTFVVETYAELWIVGPPGTGKSCTAFAFACSLNRVGGKLGESWDVLWMSWSKGPDSELKCILFRGQDEKRTCSVLPSDLPSFLQTLQEETFVFLDGYTQTPERRTSLGSCKYWRDQNKLQRRLVVVTSMGAVGKDWRPDLCGYIPSKATDVSEDLPISSRVQDQVMFKMFSWTLSEYQEALKLDMFFDHVKDELGASGLILPVERMDLLADKFFVVGGSARMMFDVSIEESVKLLQSPLESVNDINPYLDGSIGECASQTINRLLAWYPANASEESQSTIVSLYVARLISKKVGPRKLQSLAIILAKNPAMDGHLFEMWFFASLVHGGLHCSINDKKGNVIDSELWSATAVTDFDPRREIVLNSSEMWLAPLNWNNGGYDAIFTHVEDVSDSDTDAKQAGFTTKIHVRFVQVTRAKAHSLKTKFFIEFLTRLARIWVWSVEVVFVVPIAMGYVFKVPVDECQFRKDVVEPATIAKDKTMATRASSNKLTTVVAIRVFGVNYEALDIVGQKRQRQL